MSEKNQQSKKSSFFAPLLEFLLNKTSAIEAKVTAMEDINRVRLAVQCLDAGLWDWDLTSGFVYYSEKWKTMLGYAPTELGADYRTWAELVHPDDFAGVESLLNEYINGTQRYYRTEHRLRCKTGEYRWIRTQGMAHRDENGKAIRLIGWHFDIHDQKINETRIRDLATMREEILTSIRDGFIAMRPDYMITYANQAAGDIIGIPKDKIIGASYHDIFKDESAATFIKNYERAVRARIQVEFEAKYKDVFYHVLAYPSVDGLSILFRDITERVELQRDVDQQKVNLVNASRMATLGEMAGGIAHEVNNPLAVIVGKAQTLRMLLSKEPLDKLKLMKAVDTIEETGNRIAKIIRGLRSFARDEEQDPYVTVSISSVIEDTISYCQARFQSHGVELQIKHLPSTHSVFECRPAQISQVLINLLNNAFDAVLRLPERWVSVEVEEFPSKFKIYITDSGKGIPEAIAERIMNPFFTTKEVGKGTGLGLSISKGIVESHGGHIYYDKNHPNTRFVVELLVKANDLSVKSDAA